MDGTRGVSAAFPANFPCRFRLQKRKELTFDTVVGSHHVDVVVGPEYHAASIALRTPTLVHAAVALARREQPLVRTLHPEPSARVREVLVQHLLAGGHRV